MLGFVWTGIGIASRFVVFFSLMNSSIETVRSFARCPVCNKRYAPASVTPVVEGEARTVVHVLCASCHVSSILFISENQWGIASIGVLTDLNGEESKRQLVAESISADEVLGAYTLLKERSGKLSNIL